MENLDFLQELQKDYAFTLTVEEGRRVLRNPRTGGQIEIFEESYSTDSRKTETFTEYIVCSNGVTAQVNGYLCNIVSGTYVDGCDCTVYYTQYADGSYEITSVDIYGVYNPYLDDHPIGITNAPASDVGTALSVSDWGDGSYTVWESDGSWTSYEADGSFTDYDPYGNIVGGGMSY